MAWQPRQVLANITKYCFLSNSVNQLFMQWKNKILQFTYLKQSTAFILNLRNSLLNFPTVGHQTPLTDIVILQNLPLSVRDKLYTGAIFDYNTFSQFALFFHQVITLYVRTIFNVMFVIEGLQFLITSIWGKIAAIATSVREIRHEMI